MKRQASVAAVVTLALVGFLACVLLLHVPAGAEVSIACQAVRINVQGLANADITIDGTAGGVTVLAANVNRCAATITNEGTAAMRCAPATITVSATAGKLLDPGETINLGPEGREQWKCIRTTAVSTAAGVTEAP